MQLTLEETSRAERQRDADDDAEQDEAQCVAKDHPELRSAVQRALSQMVNDGTYLKILQKYGLESGNVFAK